MARGSVSAPARVRGGRRTQQCTHLVQEFIARRIVGVGRPPDKAATLAEGEAGRRRADAVAARGGRLLVGGGYFLETVMVTVWTSSRDQEYFQETMATLDANHVGGGASIWVLDGVKLELWADGGGHCDDVFALMEAHLTPLWDKGNTKLPWDKGNASLPADAAASGLTASSARRAPDRRRRTPTTSAPASHSRRCSPRGSAARR